MYVSYFFPMALNSPFEDRILKNPVRQDMKRKPKELFNAGENL
uniref:Uncharacterized protein n=1 Tax=uncultured Desulfobacterium sp. TaxID=201089 RepID=E1YMP2_9BACT|nr:unknown protein [uncultured Desulfobacterium sp.]